MPKYVYDKNIPSADRLAYARQKAQAKYRREEWAFTIDTWLAMWDQSGVKQWRGSKPHEFCMVRKDEIEAWGPHNCIIVARRKHLRKEMYEKMWNVPKTAWQDKHAVGADNE